MVGDQNILEEGGLGGPASHVAIPAAADAFPGLAEEKLLWGGSGWGWAMVGAGGSRIRGFLGPPKC